MPHHDTGIPEKAVGPPWPSNSLDPMFPTFLGRSMSQVFDHFPGTGISRSKTIQEYGSPKMMCMAFQETTLKKNPEIFDYPVG
jgi:hypothetical protein